MWSSTCVTGKFLWCFAEMQNSSFLTPDLWRGGCGELWFVLEFLFSFDKSTETLSVSLALSIYSPSFLFSSSELNRHLPVWRPQPQKPENEPKELPYQEFFFRVVKSTRSWSLPNQAQARTCTVTGGGGWCRQRGIRREGNRFKYFMSFFRLLTRTNLNTPKKLEPPRRRKAITDALLTIIERIDSSSLKALRSPRFSIQTPGFYN